jgi:hypothetical protein
VSNKALVGGKVPVGVDVGRVSHREIAVGVLAELVRLRAGGELVRGARPERPEVAAAIDPVCGVTSMSGLHAISVDHEGPRTTSAVRDAPGHSRRIPLHLSGRGRSRASDVRTPRVEGE